VRRGTVRGGATLLSDRETRLAGNAAALAEELAWLGRIIRLRMQELAATAAAIRLPDPPPVDPDDSPFGDLIDRLSLGPAERLVLVLALAPHIRPQTLDPLFATNAALGRGHTEAGGIQGRSHGGFMPTGETALLLLAGDDLRTRLEHLALLDSASTLARNGILRLDAAPAGEPTTAGVLQVTSDVIDLLTIGRVRRPAFSRDFPAHVLTTELEWTDLVLTASTRDQLREVEAWVRHRAALRRGAGLARRLRGGYRALFYGPPGTGKTLTAALLGKRFGGCDVYRIALSAVVSKYIGETEKNLERIFARAEPLDGILFFDEADALFGRRTATANAHDRYANQEISYLLQRVEDYAGLVILASNLESNIDEAFMRRFQAVVHFPSPGPAERHRLWADAMPTTIPLEPAIDLHEIARTIELSGGAIVNVAQYATLMALDAGSPVVRRDDLIAGIRRELQKEGKTL
jgi:hypothetical protein